MSPAIDITAEQQKTVLSLLSGHLPDTEAWAYGSRVRWTSRPESDLDLVVFASPEQNGRVGALREAFEESNLPFRVDLFVWDQVPESFREQIQREHVVLAAEEVRCSGNSWPRARLGDCIEMNASTYTPNEAWPFINYLDTGNITENRVAEIQNLIPGKDKIPSRARRKVQPGAIVYSTVRPNQKHFGLLKNVPENFLASTGFTVIRGKNGLADTDFVYWFLAQDQVVNRLHTIAEHSTSAYPSIRPADIEQLSVDLPPLPEQRAIAHILGTLDDKIELNRRMNKTLEATARAIFKDWFIDFGPVRAKAALRQAKRTSSPPRVSNGTGKADWPAERARAYLDNMAPEIAAPFPDRFADSELGEIPEGWEVRPVSDFSSIKGGKQLPKDKFTDTGTVPVFGGAGLMGYTDSHNADGYVISVGRVGAYCGQFFAHQGKAWINNNASLIQQKQGVSGEWLLLALRSVDIDLIKKGAAQPFSF